jgi:hypothetical protein
MSDRESFLGRWSRRKRAAAAKPREQPVPPAEKSREPTIAAPTGPEPQTEPVINLADLPPLESIGPGSDIGVFLAPGVPAALTRAALRRAWSADPAIRDFIGLSENSWDFTAPGGVPGFGSLTVEDAQRLLARLEADPLTAATESPAPEPISGHDGMAPQPRLSKAPQEQPESPADHLASAGDTASQVESRERKAPTPLKRHRHGSALPD